MIALTIVFKNPLPMVETIQCIATLHNCQYSRVTIQCKAAVLIFLVVKHRSTG